jgi:hypothetical protein
VLALRSLGEAGFFRAFPWFPFSVVNSFFLPFVSLP